jgi:hypothetical protein
LEVGGADTSCSTATTEFWPFQTMTETRQAMFDLQLDTRTKIDGVLTKEQREQLAQ